MICKACEVSGLTSIVDISAIHKTIIHSPPYYDTGGNLHLHNINKSIIQYRCSNMHDFVIAVNPEPCWCGI